ncbi:MAG: DUF2270 domain-containing protein [Myxococcales bacterium]|nr:DUF2270 domain-containing protein [Myxococcales bacterium]MCB9650319.1 DUF2270 domain-containing protein [Deltaproteobacteria bacterium]
MSGMDEYGDDPWSVPSLRPTLRDPDMVTPLVHLYRGELGRLTSYRLRLDTTTNWAVGTTAGIISFVLGTPSAPAFGLGLAVVLNLIFAHLESRRFQRFEMVRQRVRLMESGFYVELLGGRPNPRWHEELRDSYLSPQEDLPWWRAMGLRIRRNYLWLLAVVAVAWAFKLHTHPAGPMEAAALGNLSGAQVMGLVLAAALALLAWAVAVGPQGPE